MDHVRFFLACLLAQAGTRFLQKRVVYPLQEWAARLPHQERLWVRLLMQGQRSNLRAIGLLPPLGSDHLHTK